MPIYLGTHLITQVNRGVESLCVYPGSHPSTLLFPATGPDAPVISFVAPFGFNYNKGILIQPPSGGSLGTHFTIYYRVKDAGTYSVLESNVLYSLYNLDGCEGTTFATGFDYQFYVIAHNCAGASSASNVIYGKPCPGRPTHPDY